MELGIWSLRFISFRNFMVLVAGSLAFDFIMNFPGKFADSILPDKIHILNVSFLVNTLRKERGGCAANIAYNLALLKEKVAVLGTVGKDFREYKSWLKRKGVDVSLIKEYKNDFTSTGFVMTDKADNQIWGFYPGAMDKADKLSLEQIKNVDSVRLMIIAPTKTEAMIKYALECQKLKIPYMFDPGMQIPRLGKRDLRKGVGGAKILIGNDHEVERIKRTLKLTENKLLRLVEILVVTKGEEGSVILTKDRKYSIPAAKPKNISDPTGAGDAYRAGFIKGYLSGLSLDQAGKLGGLIAVYTVEKYGTTTHLFTLREIRERYKENFGEEIKI